VQTAPSQSKASCAGQILLPLGVTVQPQGDALAFAIPHVIQGADPKTRCAFDRQSLQVKANGPAWLGMALQILEAFNDRSKRTAVGSALHHNVLRTGEQSVEVAGFGNTIKPKQRARPGKGRVPFKKGGGSRHGQESWSPLRKGVGEVAFRADYLRQPVMTKAQSSEWFATWFDSPHYHRLYGHRSVKEAHGFIQTLHDTLGWSRLRLLDLACGKGRHAAAAAQLGHRVTGVDLSPQSIASARTQHQNQAQLDFLEGDMRSFLLDDRFDGVLNLFTSFGYFDKTEDHLAVLRQIHHHLKPGGFLILDFLDVDTAREQLVSEEEVIKGEVTYSIRRRFDSLPGGAAGFIKDIAFHAEGRDWNFTEKVAGLSHAQLSQMLLDCGFECTATYGNYDLQPWKSGVSQRVILHATRS